MNRKQAYEIVKEFVTNENLIRHMLAVEASMEDYAHLWGEDPNEWGLAGLLHDFDWEIHPTLETHPQEGASILRERGVPDKIIRGILSHADHTGVPRETRMERALMACDEITGLITAVALVRPSRSIHDVEVKSVKKKWGEQRFAANVNREEIEKAVEALDLDLWEHVGHILQSMQRIAPQLGLDGD
ncbi:MAG: HAD family hydrolase [Chloroflexi bacterium RBG_16_48_8]|nr:MAG: HAD family hydrolase [Chloroflexi bacterium RBG_16_48_8]